MTIYVKYKCSVCNRIKESELDSVRVTVNRCTITKGCDGLLHSIGQTAVRSSSSDTSDLRGWYPRGTTVSSSVSTIEEEVSLATSSRGGIVIAVKHDTELPNEFIISVVQRRIDAIAFNEFIFRPTTSQLVFTGRDSNGKTLRILPEAITGGWVTVSVNGVVRTVSAMTATSFTLTVPADAGAIVSVKVQLEKETIDNEIVMTRNTVFAQSTTRGSWSNVSKIRRLENGVFGEWVLFTAETLPGISIGKIKVVSTDVTSDMMLLLAHAPFETFDRYANLAVPFEILKTDYLLDLKTASSASLTAPRTLVKELHPPMQLANDCFIQPDPFISTASSVIQTDAATPVIKSSTIIGPI